MNFKEKCEDCDYGITSDRHPNDPSAKDVICWNCEGRGWLYISDTGCTSVEDVLKITREHLILHTLIERNLHNENGKPNGRL